ncbi:MULTISPECIES: CPBP family intramembrane glutamic endopeptidase [Microbacterium]|uniref:CPBP family intramembrane glutamic endopeptidase n=1 Tax=Microbacterium TaxID=33882 RepID=UPI0027D8348D|nr:MULTISPECIES: CPBP family intramembrane glutamic endopeptidase [Microbacterium]
MLLWIALAGAVVFGFSRSRPAGLLRFRSTDALWGIAAGLTLRLLQGATSGAGASAFPTVATPDGTVPIDWWSTVALRGALVSPLIEEFFFRAVLLVSLFQLLRRAAGAVAASAASVLATSGAFLLIHVPFEPLGAVAAFQVFVVGVTCGLLVLLTGRIWSAVIIHLAYNTSFLALALVGMILS